MARHRLSLTGAIVALSVGVLLPVALSTSVGIVALALGESTTDLVLGILIVSLAAAATGGGVVATVLLGRRARLARLQADFLANVSHELRTPVTSIRMYSQTLLSGAVAGDPERTAECLRTIARETEWLEAAIERVLSWRSARKDRDALRFEVQPLETAVIEAADRFRRMVPPGDADFTVDTACDRPVRHDPAGLSAAILNLLINAYKYSGPPRKIALAVADRGDRVELAVTDNGIGIPESERGRIFEPFYRAESGRRLPSAGTGLGLALVRQTARAHGGDVRVESEEGRGSTFVLHLPVGNS
jgi:two-component system phosphate regulon sensor histidine kinase PhoR